MLSATRSMLQELPVYFYSITGRSQLDCFDRSVYSQCVLSNKTWLKFRKAFRLLKQWFMSNVMINNNCHEYDFSMESLLLRCNKPFHFCSKDTHIEKNKNNVNMD